MDKPNLPVLKILGNSIAGVIGGPIIGFVLTIVLNIIGVFTKNKFEYIDIIIITGLLIFSIMTFLTFSTYNLEMGNYKSFEEDHKIKMLDLQKRVEENNQIYDKSKRNLENLIIKVDKYPSETNKILLLENVFQKIFIKHEKIITEIDKKENKNYMLNFVKISNFIKDKKNLIEENYISLKSPKIKDLKNIERNAYRILEKETNKFSNKVSELDRLIILYEQVILHSVNMIISLVNDKRFTFYEIYEFYDKMGVLNNNWQNRVSEQLGEINENLIRIDSNLERGFSNLSYVFENSFKELESTIECELQSVNSNIKFNNLLTAIQTRKLYQIRSDTKSLN